ncbi:helix-turn-helix domain-containing protein [Enterococcus entomosocium]|uniref:helix-turn-helix domain-containing protein n=1 Tax=Enterococcus entomosocium TaxID=3034352 RepID=UPI003BD7BCEA
MTTFERIKILANKQGKSVKDVARDLNFGESTIYKWKMQSPKGVDLEKVADYFNVSVDYLLGRTDSTSKNSDGPKNLTIEEALASVMSSDGKPLTDNDRQILTGIIEAYIKNKNDAK